MTQCLVTAMQFVQTLLEALNAPAGKDLLVMELLALVRNI